MEWVIRAGSVFEIKDIKSYKSCGEGVYGGANDLDVSTNGLFTVYAKGDVYICGYNENYEDGFSRKILSLGQEITSVAISFDEKIIAASSENNIYLVDTSTNKLLNTLSFHTGLVTDLAFSPDGHSLISTSLDGNLILWSLAP